MHVENRVTGRRPVVASASSARRDGSARSGKAAAPGGRPRGIVRSFRGARLADGGRGHRVRIGRSLLPLCLTLLLLWPMTTTAAPRPDKDQSRIGAGGGTILRKGTIPRLTPPADLLEPSAPDASTSPESTPPEDLPPPEELAPEPRDPAGQALELESIIAEDIPDIAAVELEPEKAKKALDAFAAIQDIMDDPAIADWPTLQDYADNTDNGRRMQARIRKFGFRDIREWNRIIMNIGFAYSSIREGSDDAILEQIRAIEKDDRLPPKRRAVIVGRLRVLIPSPNNRKVVEALMKDPEYADKLKLLDAGDDEEGDDEDHRLPATEEPPKPPPAGEKRPKSQP